MPTTPITNPASGESLVGTEPQLLQSVDPGWRHRLNLFTGRALSDTALDGEQLYRSGLLTMLAQAVTPGVVKGLALTMDTGGVDPLLVVSPGYGIAANGADVVLNRTLKTNLSSLAVVDLSTGNQQLTFHESVEDPKNTTYAGILILQPVVAQVSGQAIDTGTGPIEVSGNLGASCDQDPQEYAFEDWQIADGVRLVFLPWPLGVPALPLPSPAPPDTWRNRLAYAIFEAESLLGPDDALPWAMLGVPVALIAFDPGVLWQAKANYTAGQFTTDPNGNIQQVQTAGQSGAAQPPTWNNEYGGTTSDGTVTWINNGLGWKPLFVDCSAVVRAGGLPRRRFVLPGQAPQLLQWQPVSAYTVDDVIIDSNGKVQKVQTAGKSAGPQPTWATQFGKTTADGSVTWINNGPASWQPNTAFAAGQFIFDSNNNQQVVQTAGTSGSAQPQWNSIYLPTLDGSVTWVNNGTGNPPIIQAALAQARVAQLSEQLSQVMSKQLKFTTLADIFPTLPPSGILPAAAVDFVNHRAPWFPPNWSISAAPVHLEELETVLQTGMTEALLEAQSTAPTDSTLLEPVEVLVPLPDTLYDPNILITETVAPVFQQEVDKATQSRNLTLQRIKTIQEELNTLFAVIGPNVPANPNLVDIDAGLTADEVQGRSTPPPYSPDPTELFGTLPQSSWLPSTAYSAGQFVIDSNGALQIVHTAGTSGSAEPDWNIDVTETTTDGSVVWLNNGSWNWQPGTSYAPGQFVIDSFGDMQIVPTGGSSGSSQPTWNRTQGATTPDGIIWQRAGNAPWQADTSFTAGQLVFDSNGNIQIVQTGGISGDAPPSWNRTPGQTTQDSSVIWNNLGRKLWQPNTQFAAQQAIVDSNGMIEVAQSGGTSGATQPAWSTTSNNTIDAALSWSNHGPVTWQPSKAYVKGQIVIDSNGNLQVLQNAGTSAAAPPQWNNAAGQTTADGSLTWLYLPFKSTELQQLQTTLDEAPYQITFTDSSTTPTSYTISLISTADQDYLADYGLQQFIDRLNAKISQANDLIDMAFLTVQTDIYRYRQNILGTNEASALATSPVLANIATGDSAAATAANLQSYFNTAVPPTGSGPAAPQFYPQSSTPAPVMQVSTEAVTVASTAKATAMKQTLQTRNFAMNFATFRMAPAAATTVQPKAAPVVQQPAANLRSSLIAPRFMGVTTVPLHLTGPAQIVAPALPKGPTSNDIIAQSPLVGAQLSNIRTLTIAQRLQQSPSQEAMFYSIDNRLTFLQLLQMIESDLEVVADDLPILVDGPLPPAPPAGQAPAAVKVVAHTFSEWLDSAKQPAVSNAIQSPAYPPDASEATLFSVGVRVVEQHTALLRALEARVNQYSSFVALCTTALNTIQNNIQCAQVLLKQLQNDLLQERQNVAFTTALLNDETQRVNSVNAQRLATLQNSVQLVAYTRARTLAASDTAPSRQLVPANVASPVPACLQQSVAIPPELREIVGMLREAPVNWLPSVANLMNQLERPILLKQLAIATQARAVAQLQLPLLPSSAVGEAGVYAPAIASVYSANQQLFRGFQVERSSIQPAAIVNLSWSLQVASLQSIAAVNDLISSEAVHTEVSNATARLIQQICSVATCLYTRVSIALPIERLAWAEYLRGNGLSALLQSLAILPNWNQQSYVDRQQMQLLVDWLFQQIDTSISAATAYMSDVVRTAILLASDVPIDNIIPGNIVQRTQPSVGGVVSLNVPSERIASGMYVNLYSGAKLAARAVVSDLDRQTVSATITDVFNPGVYLEASDVAHFTAQTPRAVALRPFLR